MAKGGGGENESARMQLALRFNLSEAIAERNDLKCFEIASAVPEQSDGMSLLSLYLV